MISCFSGRRGRLGIPKQRACTVRRPIPYLSTPFQVLRSAMVVVALSILVLSGCRGEYVPAKRRVERNFAIVKVPGRTLPAVLPGNLKVSRGKLGVKIDGGRHELETLSVTPPGPGPFPLAVISHGNMNSREGRKRLQLGSYQPIAEDFAHRGYKAVVFARRGFASSTGSYADRLSGCWQTGAGRISAEDYAAVIKKLASRKDVDGSTVVAAGQSGGGFAVLALASRAPAGLIGVVNFSGGRGGNRHDEQYNCDEYGFVDAFGEFGKMVRIPSLWLYSTADHFFWPDLVRRALAAYAEGGAPVRLEWFGPLPFAGDGHRLYRGEGQYLWSPRIGAFLKNIGAPDRRTRSGGQASTQPLALHQKRMTKDFRSRALRK